jgi:hypothetical protein
MDMLTGRADHIEDILCALHEGGWYGWSDSKNKVYANLILHPKIWDSTYTGTVHEEGLIDNPHSKPTEKSLTDALAKRQSDFDTQEYARNRRKEYPSQGDQNDMIYKDMKNSTTTHKDAVEAVKTKWPKDNSGPV